MFSCIICVCFVLWLLRVVCGVCVVSVLPFRLSVPFAPHLSLFVCICVVAFICETDSCNFHLLSPIVSSHGFVGVCDCLCANCTITLAVRVQLIATRHLCMCFIVIFLFHSVVGCHTGRRSTAGERCACEFVCWPSLSLRFCSRAPQFP